MEQKGPIDLLRRMRAGAKAAKTAYKTASELEKVNQIKAVKRAAAAEKAKATREANKAKKAKEAAAAKTKRGRKPKATTPAEPVAPKKRGRKPKVNTGVNEGLSKSDKRGLAWLYTGAGVAGLATALSAKPKKSTPATTPATTPDTTFKPKGVVGKVLKSAGKYKFAKGGTTKKITKTKKR